MVDSPPEIGSIQMKRVYEAPVAEDGTRVLVERMWRRGIKKENARIDLRPQAVAPSPQLRRWFAHDPAKWDEFQRRYRDELSRNPAVKELLDLARSGPVTLVYATSDPRHNSALVLLRFLRAAIRRSRARSR